MERPEGAEFVGYIVEHPNEEEFLAGVKKIDGARTIYGWSKDPGLALVMTEFEARQKAKAYRKGATIAQLFETPTQFWVEPFNE